MLNKDIVVNKMKGMGFELVHIYSQQGMSESDFNVLQFEDEKNEVCIMKDGMAFSRLKQKETPNWILQTFECQQTMAMCINPFFRNPQLDIHE